MQVSAAKAGLVKSLKDRHEWILGAHIESLHDFEQDGTMVMHLGSGQVP